MISQGLAAALVMVTLQGQNDPGERMHAELLGSLTATKLSAKIDGAPVRDVIQALSKAVGRPIIGRYKDDAVGHGIDPELPVYLEVENASALLTLGIVLEQATLFRATTWQLRQGYIEVGTKQRLSAPSAMERRVYDISDFLIEAPYFVGPEGGLVSLQKYHSSPYKTAVLSKPKIAPARKDPAEISVELVRGILALVEPGNWDFGQFETQERIADVRAWKGKLIITAPDFVHRQIDGYPEPIPPAPLDDEEQALRSKAASAEKITITVTEITR